jgi:hypothetical protein
MVGRALAAALATGAAVGGGTDGVGGSSVDAKALAVAATIGVGGEAGGFSPVAQPATNNAASAIPITFTRSLGEPTSAAATRRTTPDRARDVTRCVDQ